MSGAVRSGRQDRPRAGAGALTWVVVIGVVVYVAVDVLLAFLRPEFSLMWNAESDYGHPGPWAWLMDLNFLLRCALSLAAAGALYQVLRRGGRARVGLALLVGWAICSGLLAFFPDDLEGQPQHGTGLVHLGLALIAFTCIALGTILMSTSLPPASAGTSGKARRILLAVAIAGAVAYLLQGAALRRPHAPEGLAERIFLGLELLWIALAAITVARHNRPSVTATQHSEAAAGPRLTGPRTG